MSELKNYREVGNFDLLSAPLNPIGAFDAEQFKKDIRNLIDKNPEDKFIAVDLIGLDFVYSDAYNAFIQYQRELSEKGGLLALLSNSKTIMDGLVKAGLDKSLKVFNSEAEMMSFSLHSDESKERERLHTDEHTEVSAVASQNTGSSPKAFERKTSQNRRFTKSFNAIVKKKDDELEKKGLGDLFKEAPTTHKIAPIFVAFILVMLSLIVFFLI